ncbi:MAG: type I DNA topoisomerase [Bacteroidales bacterium]|nr:type I DNA topoisomerase [Bacteroidales bacterium]
MKSNLVIVESPAKAKTIEKFLGDGYEVTSSFGHIRDLDKKTISVDIDDHFRPLYIVPDDKKSLVSELKKKVTQAETVWLASDEDREGEAIAWHLSEVLKLKKDHTRRIVFNEITKDAILRAIAEPRDIDINLVNAQQARRVLDRLVGFELSPVLWKKVKPALSAGRVQSVAVRLLVEREREIRNFVPTSSYRVLGRFDVPGQKNALTAELQARLDTPDKVRDFFMRCRPAVYTVGDIVTKPSRKSPAPPFTTSTLQQEASRKLGLSVSQTMSVAQRLYEAGKITYMRTDSVNLSDLALNMARKVVASEFGEAYVCPRRYKTKTKGAQEAHEAIRPTYLDKREISGTAVEKKLYDLIWKRTVASQMSDAQIEKTTVNILISSSPEQFAASGEVVRFDGFLKLYIESHDDEPEEETGGLLPPLTAGQTLALGHMTATERFTHSPARYTEAGLVKKLEELGIGRPSTYAPTISTILQRGYVVKEDKPGETRIIRVLTFENGEITETEKKELYGSEKAKLVPNDIGIIVNDFLVAHFGDVLEYNFTATVEKEFDEIAAGNMKWEDMLQRFYRSFHAKVEETMEHSDRTVGERLLGYDPATGMPLTVKMGKYGPLVQMGSTSDVNKPRFAGLLKGQHMESITLEEALALFRLPRKLGQYEDKEITASVGRFGPYLLHGGKFYSLRPDVDNPLEITTERAIEVIEAKRLADQNKLIRTFEEDARIQILNGRWGPYIACDKKNYKIPKKEDPAGLTLERCLQIIAEADAKSPRTGGKRSKKS